MIRTTNWNNFNKVRKTPPVVIPIDPKVRIVERVLKRYDCWDTTGVVCRTTRRFGKNREYMIITEAYQLTMLRNALICNDRQRIKNAINLRINSRGQRKWTQLRSLPKS